MLADRTMLRRSKFPESIHFWKANSNLVQQATLPGVNRPPRMPSGNCASISAVDLIQQKKFGSWKFFVKLIQPKPDLSISYHSIRIMMVNHCSRFQALHAYNKKEGLVRHVEPLWLVGLVKRMLQPSNIPKHLCHTCSKGTIIMMPEQHKVQNLLL